MPPPATHGLNGFARSWESPPPATPPPGTQGSAQLSRGAGGAPPGKGAGVPASPVGATEQTLTRFVSPLRGSRGIGPPHPGAHALVITHKSGAVAGGVLGPFTALDRVSGFRPVL